MQQTDSTLKNLEADEICSSRDLICFSHLRWDFVFQRPQHLLTRFAQHRRVFYFEEPVYGAEVPHLKVSPRENGLYIVTPQLVEPAATDAKTQRMLLDSFISLRKIHEYTLWYYTPMALKFSSHLQAEHIIYDCMDELSAFKGAPPELVEYEKELFAIADQVFTGGHSLYESKRKSHPNIRPFPSSIDFAHFSTARTMDSSADPADQKTIPHPRLGFFGVLDERTDFDLIAAMATAKPEWQIVLVGPVVKIDPATLPKRDNIHYLGMKDYKQLPAYIAGWDVALLPFQLNPSTQFISPTKTPEYLAAGKPVVSTPVRDVVRPYGELGLVHVANTHEEFIKACQSALKSRARGEWLNQVDQFLANSSWDKTWREMSALELEWRRRK